MIQPTPIKLNSFDDFKSACKHFDIELSINQLNLLKKYYEILLEWNKKINLISRKDTSLSTILEKHFLDSIVFLPEILRLTHNTELRAQFSVFDIGSGAGFPGVPLAILCSNWNVTLCESTRKKVNFLNELIKELGLHKRVKVINERVENINKKTNFKNCFDLVTARAIEKISKLIEYSLPLLKKNGYLLAYKSSNVNEELNKAEKLIRENKLTIASYEKEINNVKRKMMVLQKNI